MVSVPVRLNARTVNQIDSPIGATYALLDGRAEDGSLLDLAQAAPAYPPAPEVTEHIAAVAQHPHGADYVEIAGLHHLREAFAEELSFAYRGRVQVDNVLISAGCNQAFCLTTSALAAPGDEIILSLPYYFNHNMWLRLVGIVPVYLEPGPGLVPDLEVAKGLITEQTRAIVLVTPGNPSGITIDPVTIKEFATLAAERGIALILDETYRTFRGTQEPAHPLFADPAWDSTLISLHSFSKDLALPGYRVGAIVASAAFNRQAMKLLDCVAICAPRIGQEAAWAGLRFTTEWRQTKARELAEKQRVFRTAMANRPGGFELVSCGAYFGWIRHPFTGVASDTVVRDLLVGHDILVISGTAFLPDDRRMLRASFANLDVSAIEEFADRLRSTSPGENG